MYSIQFKTNAGCAPIGGVNRKSIECERFLQDIFVAAHDPVVRAVVLAASWYGFATRSDLYRIGDRTKSPIDPLAEQNRWIFDQWTEALRELTRSGKHVVIVLSSPRGPRVDPGQFVDRRYLLWTDVPLTPVPRAELQQLVAGVDARIRVVAQAIGAEVVEPFDSFCHEGSCPVADDAARPIFMDDSHIRASFARQHVEYLDRFVYVDDASTTAALRKY
jgi:hypothetical protein